jgi:hypothetical protein
MKIRVQQYLSLVSCLCGFGTPLPVAGQAPAAKYVAHQLDCARFLELAESDIQTQSAGRVREQTSARRGVWQFRAEPAVDGVSLEGWMDSLSLWRKSKEGTLRPDTDGLLGGRYRGTLSPVGAWVSHARPFIPDEVAEVSGMASALDDFFPPLPARSLAPGRTWTDSGVTIRRAADSAASGVPLARFELEIQRVTNGASVPGDTASVRIRQVSREYGTFVWHPTLGLVRRERRITVETSVPAGRAIRQPVRSRIEQRITVRRDLSAPPGPRNGHC